MAEGEERLDLGVVVVSVADVETFAVQYLMVRAGPGVPCWGVLDSLGECTLLRVSVEYTTGEDHLLGACHLGSPYRRGHPPGHCRLLVLGTSPVELQALDRPMAYAPGCQIG